MEADRLGRDGSPARPNSAACATGSSWYWIRPPTSPSSFSIRKAWSRAGARGAEQLFGWSAAKAEGRPADLFFTPEDRQQAVAAKEIVAARDQGRATDERWHLKKDGDAVLGKWRDAADPGRGRQPARLPEDRPRSEQQERLALEAERNRAGQLAARVDAQAQEIEGTRARTRSSHGCGRRPKARSVICRRSKASDS